MPLNLADESKYLKEFLLMLTIYTGYPTIKINIKAIKICSWILGVSMFSFGVLKFVNPFKSWYTVQITNSGMSSTMYWLGQIGEITTGLLFIYLILNQKNLTEKNFKWLMRM